MQGNFRSRQVNIETKLLKRHLHTQDCAGLYCKPYSISFILVFWAGLDFESVLWFVRNKHWFYWILRHQRSQEETDKQERPLHQPKSCKDLVFIICNVSWQCCYFEINLKILRSSNEHMLRDAQSIFSSMINIIAILQKFAMTEM